VTPVRECAVRALPALASKRYTTPKPVGAEKRAVSSSSKYVPKLLRGSPGCRGRG
jgi:hypothetical protein